MLLHKNNCSAKCTDVYMYLKCTCYCRASLILQTSVVRHGFMLVGNSCSGKTTIANTLTAALTSIGQQTRIVTMNPKAITAQQMYGVKDPISDEWTPGIFAWMWARYNNRALKFNTWIICDGPVDAIWIENLNTVLDDNKILTLANNDRIPMTENTRYAIVRAYLGWRQNGGKRLH